MIGPLERRELTAAGITDPVLRDGYHQARVLNARHGKTYYLATLLLPPDKRPYVHALYGFARFADDIVDDLDPKLDPIDRAGAFTAWSEAFLAALDRGTAERPLVAAVLDTIERWRLPRQHFADFLASMALDLTVTEYQTYAELERYAWGSAAVIGLQMLPILGYQPDQAELARRSAVDLGIAFQLTNFIRDVGEDLRRGRIYLPRDALQAAGVDRQRLLAASRAGLVDEPIRRLLRSEIDRARRLYTAAEPGIDVVQPSSRPCLRTALVLYRGILDEVERAGHNVFARRVSVPLPRRLRVAGGQLIRARAARPRRVSAAGTRSLA